MNWELWFDGVLVAEFESEELANFCRYACEEKYGESGRTSFVVREK